MNTALFKDVFGGNAIATEQVLKDLSLAITALPDNLFLAVFLHYYQNKTRPEVAQITGRPVHLVNTWLKSAVAFLRICYSVPS